jgi:hypothetical protein
LLPYTGLKISLFRTAGASGARRAEKEVLLTFALMRKVKLNCKLSGVKVDGLRGIFQYEVGWLLACCAV